jgi:hypothetical protein
MSRRARRPAGLYQRQRSAPQAQHLVAAIAGVSVYTLAPPSSASHLKAVSEQTIHTSGPRHKFWSIILDMQFNTGNINTHHRQMVKHTRRCATASVPSSYCTVMSSTSTVCNAKPAAESRLPASRTCKTVHSSGACPLQDSNVDHRRFCRSLRMRDRDRLRLKAFADP